MFQRILVPLDGSERAEQAIPVAVSIARAAHGSVILLQVPTKLTDHYLLSVEASEDIQDIMEAKRDEIKRYIAHIATSEALEGVGIVTEVVDGTPAETILAVTRAQKADLIVMCSHGYTGFKRWILGSIAQRVAWHSTTPVLILLFQMCANVCTHLDCGENVRTPHGIVRVWLKPSKVPCQKDGKSSYVPIENIHSRVLISVHDQSAFRTAIRSLVKWHWL